MKLFFFLFFFSQLLFAQEMATIERLSGNVTLRGKALAAGDKIKQGEDISASGKNSWVQISFNDGSKMLVKDGVLKVLKSEEKSLNLELARGLLYSFKEKNEGKLSVKTKFAVMGVRGTKFFVQADEKETYLCVCEGAVEISNEKTTQIVQRSEDATIKSKVDEFSRTKANPMMWQLATQGFLDMKLTI